MRIVKYIMVLFVFVLNSFLLNGQNNAIDSLKRVLQTQEEDTNKVNSLNAISLNYFQRRDPEIPLEIINEALVLAEKINFRRGSGYAHFYKAYYYSTKHKSEEAGHELLLSSKEFEVAKDTIGLLDSYNFLVDLNFGSLGNYNQIIDIAYKTLAIAEIRKDKVLMAHSFQALGLSYKMFDDLPEAKKNIEEALRLAKEINNSASIAQLSMQLGQLYAEEGNYIRAEESLTYGLNLATKIRKPEWLLFIAYEWNSMFYSNEANVAESRGDTIESIKKRQTAISYLDSAVKYAAPSYFGEVYANLGSLYKDLGKFTVAKDYFEKGLQSAREYDSKKDVWGNMAGLAEIYSLEGNYKKAYEYYTQSKNIQDSIAGKEFSDKALQTKLKYENEKKLAIAKAEQDKKDAAAERNKNLQYFIITILAILILAFVVIALIQYRNNKQQRKANLKVEKAYSELKSTQAQLIQSEKMASLGELTAGIAHEIQNPLNFVNNFSEVNKELLTELNEELGKGNYIEATSIAKDAIENEEKINHHGKRAEGIVKSMLQHSRNSSGKKEPTDINALADEYLRLAYHGMRAKDKSFDATTKTQFDNHIEKINVVPQDLGRVILNLINNAFYAVTEKKKAMPPSPKGEEGVAFFSYEPVVTVTTKRVGPPLGDRGNIEIRVKDNGNGIPQKALDKIFQPFFTTKPTGQGTGLGLSLSYDIVTKGHGGELKVETKEGEGSEFIIQIPVAKTPES